MGRFGMPQGQYLLDPTITLRQATHRDLHQYFEWANDPVVRAMAFQSQPILFEQHTHWFNAKLQAKDVLLLVAERDATPIGQVRFEASSNSGSAQLDYSLSAAARGLGLGAIMLHQACHIAFSTGFCTHIVASVKPHNSVSCRVLEKIGFRMSEQSQEAIDYLLEIE